MSCNFVIGLNRFPSPDDFIHGSFQRKIKRGAARVSGINFRSCEANNEMDENRTKWSATNGINQPG